MVVTDEHHILLEKMELPAKIRNKKNEIKIELQMKFIFSISKFRK